MIFLLCIYMNWKYFSLSTFFFWLLGYMEYTTLQVVHPYLIFPINVLINVLINLFFTLLINTILYHKPYISPRQSRRTLRHWIYFTSTTVVNSTTYYLLYTYSCPTEITVVSLLLFIPHCFLYEILFDFWHYWTHRMFHYPILYRYFHSVHHQESHPSCSNLSAFYQDPVDLMVSNSLPLIISQYCLPFNQLNFTVFTLYKIFIEITGHTGKLYNASSFTPLVCLPKWFHIELRTEDHDLHHIPGRCNYSKRFKIWDKVFNTYRYT